METARLVGDGQQRVRKRGADDELHNERLSKRLHGLSLDSYRDKTYISTKTTSIETPVATLPPSDDGTQSPTCLPSESKLSGAAAVMPLSIPPGDTMQLDDTAHTVYVHSLDDELSSSDSDSDAPIRFAPQFAAHLRSTRIPATIRVNAEGELGGVNLRNELVLYNIPSSLSVPIERDSVRKAIIESRARARDNQRKEREAARIAPTDLAGLNRGKGVPDRRASGGVLPWPSAKINIDTSMALAEDTVFDFAIPDPDAMEVD